MPKKKPASIDLARDRKLIADSLLTDGACISPPIDLRPHLVNVLTERDGVEACEYVLPQTAKAIVAAFGPSGWGAALDAIERVETMCRDLIEYARGEVDRVGQAGAHDAVTKARVAQDILKALGVKR